MSEQAQTHVLYLVVPKDKNLSEFYDFSATRLFWHQESADLFVQRRNAANHDGWMKVVPIPVTQHVPEVVDRYYATWTYATEELTVRRATPKWSDDPDFQPKPDAFYGQFGMVSEPPDHRRVSGVAVVNNCSKDARIECDAPTAEEAIQPILHHLQWANADRHILSKVQKELDTWAEPATSGDNRKS